MKFPGIAFVVCLGYISCIPAALVNITVSENAGFDRVGETVEINLSDIPTISAYAPEGNFYLISKNTREKLPFQTYRDKNGLETMVFQLDIKAGRKERLAVIKGVRPAFDTVVYSRQVPERRDDYAYENDCIAGRIYGPRLKKPRTLGTDVWTKSVSHPIINERFKRGQYHKNFGDGMDCYKVGYTLGAGALAPLDSCGRLILGDNWEECTHITDGLVRTKASFTHGPFSVDGKMVSVSRDLTLDAGSHFMKMATTFRSENDSLDVALAAVMHSPYVVESENNWIAFIEPASDSKHPEVDGDIFIALILEPGTKASGLCTIDDHAALRVRIPSGKPIICWTGSAWSHADIKSQEKWRSVVEAFVRSITSPVSVKVN